MTQLRPYVRQNLLLSLVTVWWQFPTLNTLPRQVELGTTSPTKVRHRVHFPPRCPMKLVLDRKTSLSLTCSLCPQVIGASRIRYPLLTSSFGMAMIKLRPIPLVCLGTPSPCVITAILLSRNMATLLFAMSLCLVTAITRLIFESLP